LRFCSARIWIDATVSQTYDDILDHCCFAWNKLIDMPWKIISIGTKEWVRGKRGAVG
jgi:hypothetical protein